MIPPKKKSPEGADRAARAIALHDKLNKVPAPVDDDDDEGSYLDVAEDLKKHYLQSVENGDLPEPNGPLPELPPAFSQVSLCSKGPCRHFFEVVHPIAQKRVDEKAPGGLREMLATTRRCLIGAIKIDQLNPLAVSTMKSLATEAPYGVQQCSHWTPYTPEEIADLQTRRQAAEADLPEENQ